MRGVLQPVLDSYAVGSGSSRFLQRHRRPRHLAGDDGRKLIALYVRDLDPSVLYMSEE